METPLTSPFQIALALSGGGYRAAAFHLGTLKLLDEVGLLPGVTVLSTVTGGTIVGAAWALSLAKGKSFGEFYKEFSSFLRDTPLMADGFRRLESGRVPRASLICAVADVYDEHLFKGTSFGDVLHAKTQLEDVVFNATEFETGVGFRFQRSSTGRAKIGNGNVWINDEDAAALRLADIVAASSCFPGGFEPILFPDDFRGASGVEVKRSGNGTGRVALMDGGIYDNQGIEALTIAVDRRTPPPDLLFISDATPVAEALYTPPSPHPEGRLTLRTAYWLVMGVLALVGAYLAVDAIVDLCAGRIVAGLAQGVLLIAIAGVAWGIRWLRVRLVPRLERQVPGLDISELGKLTVGQALDLADARAGSLLALTGNVFLKRVRALVYADLYRRRDMKDARVSNLIYDLDGRAQSGVAHFKTNGWPLPEALGLDVVAKRASTMPTTLWFTEPKQLEDLVGCGYATACFNVIEHIVRRFGPDESTYSPEVLDAYQKCVGIWVDGAKP